MSDNDTISRMHADASARIKRAQEELADAEAEEAGATALDAAIAAQTPVAGPPAAPQPAPAPVGTIDPPKPSAPAPVDVPPTTSPAPNPGGSTDVPAPAPVPAAPPAADPSPPPAVDPGSPAAVTPEAIQALAGMHFGWNAGDVPEAELAGLPQTAAATSALEVGGTTNDNSWANTGAQSGIGMVPNWTARWMICADPRAEQYMVLNDKLAAAVRWHYQEPGRDGPIRLWLYPNATMESLDGTTAPVAADGASFIQPEAAHQRMLSVGRMLRAKLRGDAVDFAAAFTEHLYQVVWNVLSVPVQAREGLCIYNPVADQQRASAWKICAHLWACRLVPDDHEFRPWLFTQIKEQLRFMKEVWITATRDTSKDHPDYDWPPAYLTNKAGLFIAYAPQYDGATPDPTDVQHAWFQIAFMTQVLLWGRSLGLPVDAETKALFDDVADFAKTWPTLLSGPKMVRFIGQYTGQNGEYVGDANGWRRIYATEDELYQHNVLNIGTPPDDDLLRINGRLDPLPIGNMGSGYVANAAPMFAFGDVPEGFARLRALKPWSCGMDWQWSQTPKGVKFGGDVAAAPVPVAPADPGPVATPPATPPVDAQPTDPITPPASTPVATGQEELLQGEPAPADAGYFPGTILLPDPPAPAQPWGYTMPMTTRRARVIPPGFTPSPQNGARVAPVPIAPGSRIVTFPGSAMVNTIPDIARGLFNIWTGGAMNMRLRKMWAKPPGGHGGGSEVGMIETDLDSFASRRCFPDVPAPTLTDAAHQDFAPLPPFQAALHNYGTECSVTDPLTGRDAVFSCGTSTAGILFDPTGEGWYESITLAADNTTGAVSVPDDVLGCIWTQVTGPTNNLYRTDLRTRRTFMNGSGGTPESWKGGPAGMTDDRCLWFIVVGTNGDNTLALDHAWLALLPIADLVANPYEGRVFQRIDSWGVVGNYAAAYHARKRRFIIHGVDPSSNWTQGGWWALDRDTRILTPLAMGGPMPAGNGTGGRFGIDEERSCVLTVNDSVNDWYGLLLND